MVCLLIVFFLTQTGSEFLSAYYVHFNNDRLFRGLKYNNLSQTCYDGTWALALAINETIQGKQGHNGIRRVLQDD